MNIKRLQKRGPAASRLIATIVAAALAAFASGCSKQGAQQKGGGSMPMLEVGVYTLKSEPVTLSKRLPGRTVPYRVAEVRARVSGIVQKRLFEEGSLVKEGQQLYQIDNAPYVAALESAKAALARSEANLSSATSQAQRIAELVKINAVSKQDHDNAVAQAKAFAADVEAGKAAVANAEINLGYTKVYSPLTGRIGKSEVTEGAYVQAATATLLATVQQIDPIYVDIVQPSGQMLKLDQYRAAGKLLPPPGGFDTARLFLSGERPYTAPGKLQFADITVQQSTSSVLLRAEFANPAKDGAHAILPGMFVRAEIPEGIMPEAILVPQQGVSRNQKGLPTAIVVATVKGKDGKEMTISQIRLLEVDRTIGDKWLVTSGLSAGDQVIVENLQMLMRFGGANVPVKPVPAGQNSPGSLRIE